MNKYFAIRTWSNLCQRWFDSKAEATRGEELHLLQQAGGIEELEYQISFMLHTKPKVSIKIDFAYIDNGEKVYEDTKGVLTRDFRTKLAWLEQQRGIKVVLHKQAYLTKRTPIKHTSNKQKEKNKHWKEVTNQKASDLHYLCQWCGKLGDMLIMDTSFCLDGHHIIKRRYNIHTYKNCYICHRLCHCFIEDHNIDVGVYPNKKAWEGKE